MKKYTKPVLAIIDLASSERISNNCQYKPNDPNPNRVCVPGWIGLDDPAIGGGSN